MKPYVLTNSGIYNIHDVEANSIFVFAGDVVLRFTGTSRCFVPYIYYPCEIEVYDNAKVWQTGRCAAFYLKRDMKLKLVGQNQLKWAYCNFYDLGLSERRTVKLYKRVQDDYRDYYSGEYEYLPGKTVVAEDWLPFPNLVCGNGLHLCATIEQSKQWNEGGRLLACEVCLDDLVIFPYNIEQVRCRKVRVLEEVTHHVS